MLQKENINLTFATFASYQYTYIYTVYIIGGERLAIIIMHTWGKRTRENNIVLTLLYFR